jgi:hypothetical protein
MKNSLDKIVSILIVIAGFSIGIAIAAVVLAIHKHSLEHIVGHPVSWWDAFWTK